MTETTEPSILDIMRVNQGDHMAFAYAMREVSIVLNNLGMHKEPVSEVLEERGVRMYKMIMSKTGPSYEESMDELRRYEDTPVVARIIDEVSTIMGNLEKLATEEVPIPAPDHAATATPSY